MFQLSAIAVKEEYLQHDQKVVMLDNQEVTIRLERSDTRSGSYERGFKFGSITYGILKRVTQTPKGRNRAPEYSCNHGKTWHSSEREAKKSKGKTIVARSMHGEFAFEGIQKINREYYGPSYKWTP